MIRAEFEGLVKTVCVCVCRESLRGLYVLSRWSVTSREFCTSLWKELRNQEGSIYSEL